AADGGYAAIVFIFHFEAEDFARAFEAGDGFGQLRADGNDLKNRSDQHREKRGVHEEHAGGHAAGDDAVRADVHDDGGNDADQRGAGKTHQGSGSERLEYVVQQALYTDAENSFFALFGVVALDDADATERFREAAGN